MKPKKVSVSLTLDEDLIELLKEYSERADRSVSSYVNLMLRSCLNRLRHPLKDN